METIADLIWYSAMSLLWLSITIKEHYAIKKDHKNIFTICCDNNLYCGSYNNSYFD